MDEHPVYVTLSQKLRETSYFLSPSNYKFNEEALRAANLPGLRALMDEGEAKIKKYLELMTEVAQVFNHRRDQARKEGLKIPDSLPEDLAVTDAKIRARLDIAQEELQVIRRLLADKENLEIKEIEDKCLIYGPMGTKKLSGGVAVHVDFQPTKFDEDGVLVIDCPKSPYNGMSVESYVERVVRPFRAAQAAKIKAYYDMDERNRKKAKQPPTGVVLIPWADLPPRPEDT